MTSEEISEVSPDAAVPSHRALVLNAGRTRIEIQPQPPVGPGELLLEVLACGLCGTDLYKLDRAARAAAEGRDGPLPDGTVLGHEVVGRVIAVGEPHDNRFALGDRCVVPHHLACGACRLCRLGSETRCETFLEQRLEPGGFADVLRVDREATARSARRVPPSMSNEDACLLEPAACVLRAIERSGLSSTDDGTVAILGAGSMGLLHMLSLEAFRPRARVVMFEPQAVRRDYALSFGAAACYCPHELRDGGSARALAAQCDVVFDTVGGIEALRTAQPLLRPGGTVVLFAHAAHPPEDHDPPADHGPPIDTLLNRFFHAEQRIVTSYSGALGEQEACWQAMCRASDSGAMTQAGPTLSPGRLVTHRVSLDDFARALELAREPETLKVLIVPGGGSPVDETPGASGAREA